jgi:hypothetical protein
MQRKHSWPEDLHAFIEARKREPFCWGKNDCCIFTADAIEAMTGVDVAADYRHLSYSDEAGAFAALHSVTGGQTVEDAATYAANKYGMKLLPSVLFAQRGDLVLFDQATVSGNAALPAAGAQALGIVNHNGKHALFVSTRGVARVPVKSCTKAWRV